MPIADINRRKASLRHNSPAEALRVAPAADCAGVAEGAGVSVAGADLGVAARRGVYLTGITLRFGDGQNGERDQNSERERRKEGCTPPPRESTNAADARVARRSAAEVRRSALFCTATLYTSSLVGYHKKCRGAGPEGGGTRR